MSGSEYDPFEPKDDSGSDEEHSDKDGSGGTGTGNGNRGVSSRGDASGSSIEISAWNGSESSGNCGRSGISMSRGWERERKREQEQNRPAWIRVQPTRIRGRGSPFGEGHRAFAHADTLRGTNRHDARLQTSRPRRQSARKTSRKPPLGLPHQQRVSNVQRFLSAAMKNSNSN